MMRDAHTLAADIVAVIQRGDHASRVAAIMRRNHPDIDVGPFLRSVVAHYEAQRDWSTLPGVDSTQRHLERAVSAHSSKVKPWH